MVNMAISEPQRRSGLLSQGSQPGVLRVKHGIVNSYLVGEPEIGSWALVDTGLTPWSADRIKTAAEKRFGPGSRPSVIVLTHGHFDHVGAAYVLARHWDVPVYAHELELPYLTGRSAYPPPDPTVGGGLMARLSGLYPREPINLGNRVQPLPPDGVVPGMPGWRWLHTPGHSPGHISLFRFTDRVLIAGDAFVTTQQESLLSVLLQRQKVCGPPAYFTPDWEAARHSLEVLLGLQPEVAATGHGVPMMGEALREQLSGLVRDFDRRVLPHQGRYVRHPAIADAGGVVSVPPPVPDPLPSMVAASIAVVGLLGMAAMLERRSRLARRVRRRT